MHELNELQREVADSVSTAFHNGAKRGYIYLPVGLGKNRAVSEIVKRDIARLPHSNVLVLHRTQVEAQQFTEVLREQSGGGEAVAAAVTVSTYHSARAHRAHGEYHGFSLIVLFDPEHVPATADGPHPGGFPGNLLGVFSRSHIPADNLFFGTPAFYLYNDPSIRFTEYWYINRLILPMLQQMGFSEIQTDSGLPADTYSVRPDIVALKGNIRYIIELKSYRGVNNDQRIIQNAIGQIQKYRDALHGSDDPRRRFGIILLCHVDSATKQALWERETIFVWDIRNLLYLCNTSPALLSALSVSIPYSLGGLAPEAPLGLEFEAPAPSGAEETDSGQRDLISKLTACKHGKNHAAEYEEICTAIIKYLFAAEFSQFSEQHRTRDAMFRMDVLCALKGTTAFWQMLTHYYNTKFVVFEFKNYAKRVQQNLVYVTDKYLFHPALRNVAFIISRKGFDKHAHEAAMGILKESGKLIVDLTDDDLIKMILAKTDGEEPSDYLLNKVEHLLMGVSV